MVKKLKTKNSKLFWFPYLLAILLFVYSIFNMAYSQTVSPLYLRVVNDDRQATGKFLSIIRTLPVFTQLFEINKNIYGRDLEQTVFAHENKIKEEIIQLENILLKNAKARDVLLRLSTLYDQLGNKIKAEEYLKKAKEIDPTIN